MKSLKSLVAVIAVLVFAVPAVAQQHYTVTDCQSEFAAAMGTQECFSGYHQSHSSKNGTAHSSFSALQNYINTHTISEDDRTEAECTLTYAITQLNASDNLLAGSTGFDTTAWTKITQSNIYLMQGQFDNCYLARHSAASYWTAAIGKDEEGIPIAELAQDSTDPIISYLVGKYGF